AVPATANQRGGAERGREDADTGPQPDPAAAAVAARLAGPPDPRLSPQRLDQLVCGARDRQWQGRGGVSAAAYGRGLLGLSPAAGAHVSAARPARDSRQLVDPHDASRAGVARAAPPRAGSFFADRGGPAPPWPSPGPHPPPH